MFTLEIHRYQENWPILSLFCLSPRTVPVSFLEINIKILTDLLGSTKIVVLMVSGQGVRKCVFFQSHFTLILATPNPSMESNTTSLYLGLAVANLVQCDPNSMGELD